jgi:GntR family transcriptional regulator
MSAFQPPPEPVDQIDDAGAISARPTIGPRRPMRPSKRVYSPNLVYDTIRIGIRNATYTPGALISEDILMRSLNVTRASVREALGRLTAEGVLQRAPRRGTSPTEATVHITSQDVMVLDEEDDSESSPRVREVPKSRHVYPADPVLAAKLRLAEGELIRVDQSVIHVDEGAVGIRTSFTPLAVRPAGQTPPHGIHLLSLLTALGITVSHVDSTFEAISADPEAAQILGVAEGSPVLLREMIHYSAEGEPVMLSTVRHRSDRVIVHTSRDLQRVILAASDE